MANLYYARTYNFTAGTKAKGDEVKVELDALVSGFDLLPAPADVASVADISPYVGYATEWATKAEDSLISVAAGGNGTTDYSALHHAAKASASAAAALVSEGNASTSETNAGTSETNASTSETNAEDSNLEAGDWANRAEDLLTRTFSGGSPTDRGAGNYSALHHASKASASAAAALVSEGNASTSETNAAASESAADADATQTALDAIATAADAVSTAADVVTTTADAAATAADVVTVAGIYDDFDDRYLGSKASDPTLDNDGAALLTGALYWNSTSDVMRVWKGAAWTDISPPNKASQTEVDDGTDDAKYITPLTLTNAPQLFRRNLLINSQMSGARLGTSFVSPAAGDYTLDMWTYGKVGSGTVTVSQSTDVPTIAEAGVKISHSLLVECTATDALLGSTDFYHIRQKVEGSNFRAIAGVGSVMSFWHKHSITGTHCVFFRNSGKDRSLVQTYTQSVADTWEYAEVLILASPSAGTWDYDTGVGLTVGFTIAAESNFHTTAGAWQTGDFVAVLGHGNNMSNVTNDFRIAIPQVERGDIATRFEMRPQSVDDALSARYHQILRGIGIQGFATSASQVRISTLFPEMRAAPTVTLLDSTPTVFYNNASEAGSSSALSSVVGNTLGFRGLVNGYTALTAGDPVMFSEDVDLFELDSRL